MTPRRRRALRGLLKATWWGSALTTAFALIGLLVITGVPGAPRLALRADTYNQMTGVGPTASSVTVNWTNGLLNSSNQPVTGTTTPDDGGTELNPNADRASGSGSPLSFMDGDFKNLQITVSQTENIGQQGVTVSWTGANPTGDTDSQHLNFMQMMECYGDSASGPSPEDCLFGSDGSQADDIENNFNAGGDDALRGGYLCPAGASPSTTNPPAGLASYANSAYGCDPYEPAAETPSHCDPTAGASDTCATGLLDIPFVPVNDSGNPVYSSTTYSQDFKTTNEVPFAVTNSDGTGQRQFATYTANQAPELGCGAAESSGQTRNCWLVIVPRGSYQPNGYQASPQASPPGDGVITSSPLSAGNWAQRIQIHLDYAPLAVNCPATSVPQLMVGTQVAYRAVTSWQQALNQQAKCSTVYSYTASTESENTSQLTGAASGLPDSAGLAFTTVSIGSEATREGGGTAPTLPNILYAPVAVTAIDFGFNINQSTGQITTPIKLTPALVSRSLTQAYKLSLPDWTLEPSEQPAGQTWWAQNNPASIWNDPEFQKLNPEVPPINGTPSAPLFTGDHSGDNQLVWQYIQSDPTTANWLDGNLTGSQADPSDPVNADPFYVSLSPQLGKSPAPDSYSVAYTPTLLCSQSVNRNDCNVGKASTPLNSVDMLAVQNNFDQAASTVLSAVSPALTTSWDSGATAPDSSTGWWGAAGPEPPGQVLMWAINDMPDLAAYGIISAALCDASGANCVQPSVASVSAALHMATTDSVGLTEVNPATVEAADASSTSAGAYPLVDVVYAAVPTNQSATALTDYANFISYAANQGQTAGTTQGDLPAGYLPLTSALQAQANSVVTQLKADAAATPSPSTSTTPAGNTTTPAANPTPPAANTPPAGNTPAGNTTPAGNSNAGNTTPAANTNAGGTKPGGGATTGSHPSATTSTHAAQPAATSSHTPAVGFNVLPPSAEAAAGTTQGTIVGSVRVVLIIVLIIGAAGAVAGTLLRYGHVPERFSRSRSRPDSS